MQACIKILPKYYHIKSQDWERDLGLNKRSITFIEVRILSHIVTLDVVILATPSKINGQDHFDNLDLGKSAYLMTFEIRHIYYLINKKWVYPIWIHPVNLFLL